MDYSQARQAMRDGHAVKRPHWYSWLTMNSRGAVLWNFPEDTPRDVIREYGATRSMRYREWPLDKKATDWEIVHLATKARAA